jgi:hypothetical protein
MKPDLDKGSLPVAYVNAEIRRTGAALLISHVTAQIRARGLGLESIIWNGGQGAHDRREWHAFHISAATASATLRVSDEELIAVTSDEWITQSPICALVRAVLDDLARAELDAETV